jgi:hypothetical protein
LRFSEYRHEPVPKLRQAATRGKSVEMPQLRRHRANLATAHRTVVHLRNRRNFNCGTG